MLEFVNRSGSNCYKWDMEQAKDSIPMWIADMDFKAAKPIREAMKKRLDHGVFGYNIVPKENYEAVASWFSRRHGWDGINETNLLYTTAVVPAVSAIFKALQLRVKKCQPLRVLTFTPAYNCFFACIDNMDCQLVPSPLVLVNNRFEIDWDDVEAKAKEADVFLLCNPHNPTGRVWTKEELERLTQIMRKEKLFVLTDEIHGEFTFPGHTYTPFATIAIDDTDFCVCTSASKAFNIAGLLCANIFVPNKELFGQISHALEIHEVNGLNPFGLVAQVAAYNESEQWIEALNAYVYENYCLVRDFIEQRLPMLAIHETEGTYLAWVNIEGLNISAQQFCDELRDTQHVLFNPSTMYGCEGYVRVNLATSKELVQEALLRLEAYIVERRV